MKTNHIWNVLRLMLITLICLNLLAVSANAQKGKYRRIYEKRLKHKLGPVNQFAQQQAEENHKRRMKENPIFRAYYSDIVGYDTDLRFVDTKPKAMKRAEKKYTGKNKRRSKAATQEASIKPIQQYDFVRRSLKMHAQNIEKVGVRPNETDKVSLALEQDLKPAQGQ